MRTRRVLLSCALVVGLAGCTQSCAVWSALTGDKAETITVETVRTACKSYASALQLVDAIDDIHPLSQAQVKKVNDVVREAKKICPPDGTMPTNLLDGLGIVLKAVVDIPAAIKGGP